MHPSGKLIASGMIAREQERHSRYGLEPSGRLVRALEPPARGLEDILQGLFANPAAPDTQWQDFEHLGEARDFAARLLKGALGRGAAGVNILFYGPPGTGKTEFCKVLAAQLGVQLFAVGETDDDGDEPTRAERQAQLRLGQRLLAGRRDALVLFDEMEDLIEQPLGLFFGRRLRGTSKVHLHRLMETNPVPTLWTTNEIADCDAAFLRRMTFTLAVEDDIRAFGMNRGRGGIARQFVLGVVQTADGLPFIPSLCGDAGDLCNCRGLAEQIGPHRRVTLLAPVNSTARTSSVSSSVPR